MASGTPSLDGNGSNGMLSRNFSLNSGSSRDYDNLKQQCDKAVSELTLLKRQHSETARRCDHAMKELDYYRGQHRAAMNQLEASAQESAALRTKYADIVNEKQRLEREVQALRSEVNDLHCQQEVLVSDNNNADSLYVSLSRRNEAVRDDYEALRKAYDDQLSSHTTAIAKLELAQDETARLNKQIEELTQERNNAVRERNGLKQQCTAAIRQWDMALRERNEYRDALVKVQQQREEAVKEVNQAMAVRMKATKDIKRLTEERNAAMQEYTLIMSERDTVHKEIEKLNDDLSKESKKTKMLEAENKDLIEEKKALNYQMEMLKREIASALHDRDKALKECNDLREKFGEYNAAKEDSRDLIKSRLECVTCPGENSARKEVSSVDSRSLAQRQRLDNLDQANQELESLRKSLDKAQSELTESLQEAEVSKRRRDWAFSERDKIVLERESIRTLCDKLRKERDRAVSDLAEALRDSDDLKKQRNEAMKELKVLKEALEAHLEKEANVHQFNSFGHNHSHDSAIDSDMQEWETEILDMDLTGLASDGDLGFELVGGRDDPHYPNDSGIYVASVTKGSIADGKLRVNDCISRVNNVDCTSVSKRMVLETVRASLPKAHMVVRRRRRVHSRCLYTTQLPAGNHGLSLEMGMYISKISPGSTAAKEGNLAVGDRVLSINNKAMYGLKNYHEAMSSLNSDRTDITITVLKSLSGNQGSGDTVNFMSSNHHNQRKVNRCSQTEDIKNFNDDFDKRYLMPSSCSHGQSYKVSKGSQEKNIGTWEIIREKLDMVRRKHNKDRRNDEKNKYTLSTSFDPEQDAIAELDLVIESYHGNNGNNTNTVHKRSKRNRSKESSIQEKNGGTWPKARSNIITNTTGTIVNPRKRERPPLTLLLNGENHDTHCCSNNRNSTPLPLTIAPNLNRHTVYKSMDNNDQVHFPSKTLTSVNESFQKLREKKISDFERERDSNRLSMNMNSDNSLDYSIKTNQIDKELEYFSSKNNSKTVNNKYSSDSESNIGHDTSLTNVTPSHVRLPSQLGYPLPRIPHYPFHPHPHHLHSSPIPLHLPSSQSGDSFCFEPPYAPGFHSQTPSVDVGYIHRKPITTAHSHTNYCDKDIISYYEAGTFPRKKENQRFRIPSNPSVTSKSSASKVSNGSIERASERDSPMPTFHVEVLSSGNSSNKRNSLPDYCWSQKPSPGELRRVHIDKSAEPLGIQISCPDSGGIFVSTVNEHSLASQVGLQIGDQLLEVCGINMRSATYQLAANVLRQCGNSITMLVQYMPDKYHELEGSGSCSSSQDEDGDGEPTPCNSPRGIRKSQPPLSLPLSELDTGQNTLTRSQIQQVTSTLQRQNSIVRSSAEDSQKNLLKEPRYLVIETKKCSNLGIRLVGGNAVGIFVHSVQPDSLADNAGLRTGDQILKYNGVDLRHATAEEAAYELAKPADKVTVLAHYNLEKYNEIKDKPGDSLYVRCGFDRSGELDQYQLCFNKDDVLYVDNTMYNGVPGNWRAWKLDSEGHRQLCGIIPSKYKVEDELLLRRSSGDLEGRGSTSARRSFFRRKKHQRGGSRDSKELASFSNVTLGWYSDSGTLHEDISLCSYQRVERLDYTEYRPVLVLGPLAECVVDKLVTDFPDLFRRCVPEARHCVQSALDQELADNLIIDYKRKGTYYECTTVNAIKTVSEKNLHCIIDISVASVDKLHRHQIYPIVLLIKFKSTKQIKEVKDTRYPLDKVSAKAAKEMYEVGQKLEAEYKHRISAVIPAGVNIAYMCTQVKAAVDSEQNKSLWVPCQNN